MKVESFGCSDVDSHIGSYSGGYDKEEFCVSNIEYYWQGKVLSKITMNWFITF